VLACAKSLPFLSICQKARADWFGVPSPIGGIFPIGYAWPAAFWRSSVRIDFANEEIEVAAGVEGHNLSTPG
jgi:hypothetical protein